MKCRRSFCVLLLTVGLFGTSAAFADAQPQTHGTTPRAQYAAALREFVDLGTLPNQVTDQERQIRMLALIKAAHQELIDELGAGSEGLWAPSLQSIRQAVVRHQFRLAAQKAEKLTNLLR